MSENPLCVVSDDDYKSTIYVNREGLARLKQTLSQFDNDSCVFASFVAFQNGNWKSVAISLSSQADFDCGAKKCTCGCQDKFAALEDKVKTLERKTELLIGHSLK
jgi:hypothetical protein